MNKIARWQFWIDRGGTFTDVIGRAPNGSLHLTKLPSAGGNFCGDAAVAGIRQLLKVAPDVPLSAKQIETVRMGTTVATNALLERRGAKVALVITRGFADALRIRHQDRPRLFDFFPRRSEPLYTKVIEVDERVMASGAVVRKVEHKALRLKLEKLLREGIKAVAVVCMHGYRHQQHEAQIAQLCRTLGFEWVYASGATEPLIGMVGRGETTVADAYLTPLLRYYAQTVATQLGKIPLQFMQSNGGLVDAAAFSGRNAVLSGPAGGVIGTVKIGSAKGFERLVSFDMGGTSTDVAHWADELERTTDTELADVSLRAPMLRINTIAAGGGSECWFGSGRLRIGPQSSGADPGPACYGRGGPLTVTDCNLLTGRIVPEAMPAVFGPDHIQRLDELAARRRLRAIVRKLNRAVSVEQLAADFLDVANENMAKAVKSISVQRGHDLARDYVLVAFGGAGGQHACALADKLNIERVFVHPLAGVLSATGIGLAAVRAVRQCSLEIPLSGNHKRLKVELLKLANRAKAEVKRAPGQRSRLKVKLTAQLRYTGSFAHIDVEYTTAKMMLTAFAKEHKRQFGFARPGVRVVIAGAQAEAISEPVSSAILAVVTGNDDTKLAAHTRVFENAKWHRAKLTRRHDLAAGQIIVGPALVLEDTATTYVGVNWRAVVGDDGSMLITRKGNRKAVSKSGFKRADPARLEIYNNLFMSVAEQMGHVLRGSAMSVNIKERLDFSCAVFDAEGLLVANAPHIPVHLGSMGASVQAVIRANGNKIRRGDAWLLNAPYAGGTHLPDLTVVSPVFITGSTPDFFVCSRGHHADVGGITPGSMPPHSTKLTEEGILFDNFPIVSRGKFNETSLRTKLGEGPWPARNPDQNVADLLAQLAANAKGAHELGSVCSRHSYAEVTANMRHIQNNAAKAVAALLTKLRPGSCVVRMDNGHQICVKISIHDNQKRATIDFSGTSGQVADNTNAPRAVVQAAVYYVLRGLLAEDIPLNAGCLRPIRLQVPAQSVLNPDRNAAVAAGNVETSQAIVDCLLGALGVCAGGQGTMNNVTIGNERYQYYETVCGGTGAGPRCDGSSAIHAHMTNTRITDPEVLEEQLPVVVERFGIRRGSGGGGRHRGGDGVVRGLRFLEDMQVAVLADRRRIAPAGSAGGEDGKTGINWVRTAQGTRHSGAGRALWHVKAGDTFELRTPGGGGWGKVK